MNISPTRDPASRPGEPTDASPGSSRKIRVLTERATRRESLFHPSDNLKRQPIGHDEEPEPMLPELEVLADVDLEMELEMEVDLAG